MKLKYGSREIEINIPFSDVIEQKELPMNKNAIKEARKLGIATLALIDTDCDPDLVDLPIPGNDDSMRSIDLIVNFLADAVVQGKVQEANEKQQQAEGAEVAK